MKIISNRTRRCVIATGWAVRSAPTPPVFPPIHDDCRTGIAIVGGIEPASLKQGNLQSREVIRTHDEVAAPWLLVGFRDRLTLDLEVLLVGKTKREIAGDCGGLCLRKVAQVAQSAFEERCLAMRLAMILEPTP